MNRLFLAVLLVVAVFVPVANAQEEVLRARPDDRVSLTLSAEDWVTTKTAHVTIGVEAAVSGGNAGSMRADMDKAVNELAKADWRLTSFDRNQDQTGLERWSASFEARLPESQLNGLAESAKKLSKAGLQLSVIDTDFTPTLEEKEAVRASIRTQIYKSANEQLALLNAAMPGRNYRIAMINFMDEAGETPIMRPMAAPKAMMLASGAPASITTPSAERSEKIVLRAQVVYAALPTPVNAPERH